jgi:hypothetical protein
MKGTSWALFFSPSSFSFLFYRFGTVEMAWVMDDLVVVVRSCHGEK